MRLADLLVEIEHPRPAPVPPMPAIARKISGKAFFFGEQEDKDDLWGLESVSLDFI